MISVGEVQKAMINKKQLFEQPASNFFFLLYWSNIQITMCFTEVVDLIFSYNLLIAYCVAGTVQRTLQSLLKLKRLALLLSSPFYR